MRVRSRSLLFLSLLALAPACSDAGYEVWLSVPDPFVDAMTAEVAVHDGSCPADFAAEPPDGAVVVHWDLDDDPPALPRLTAGRHGFAARVRDARCAVRWAGCTEAELESGGEGSIRVRLTEIGGPSCPPGTLCDQHGHCVSELGEGCEGVLCAPRSVCIDGSCNDQDPCAEVDCPEEGTVCSRGSCVRATVDEDGDGSPASDDCDDSDPSVGAGTTKPCSTACGDGTTTCVAREWQPCTAPTDCTCAPGETRREACGNCGTATRPCGEDGRWGTPGACEGEGDCAGGSTEVRDCASNDCGVEERTCDADCRWGAWGACTGETECDRGATEQEACGNCGSRERTCSDQCLWGAFGACSGEGACENGQTETRACGNCGSESRTCGADCNWGTWSSCGEGVCTAGASETRPCGNCGTQLRTCGADCNWGGWQTCMGEGACTPGTTRQAYCGACGTLTETCTASCTWSQSACGNSPSVPGSCEDVNPCTTDTCDANGNCAHASCGPQDFCCDGGCYRCCPGSEDLHCGPDPGPCKHWECVDHFCSRVPDSDDEGQCGSDVCCDGACWQCCSNSDCPEPACTDTWCSLGNCQQSYENQGTDPENECPADCDGYGACQ